MPAPAGRTFHECAPNRFGFRFSVMGIPEPADLANTAPEHSFVALMLRHAEGQGLEP